MYAEKNGFETIFRQRLKTHLFRRSDPGLIIWHLDL